MLAYIGRRALLAIFTVWAISMLAFAIIQLPPGDYVTSYIAQMASMGSVVSDEEAQNLRSNDERRENIGETPAWRVRRKHSLR